MASPPSPADAAIAAPTPPADPSLSARPSLRQRLFSSGSRKGAAANVNASTAPRQEKDGEAGSEAIVDDQSHPTENSASTSSTLTAAPTAVDEAQGPAPVSVSSLSSAVDVDREQASTINSASRRVPFYRRKAKSSSDGALSDPKSGRLRSRSRPSLFSRVVHRVVPCVSPDPALLENVDDQVLNPTPPKTASTSTSSATPNTNSSSSATHKMQQISPVSATPAPTTPSTPVTPVIDLELLPLTIPSVPGHPPPSPTDSEIIVTPPPSTHLLPEDETDGLTSGAVQPPGSTGNVVVNVTHQNHNGAGQGGGEIARSHTLDSADESDGTSFTDDEGDDRRVASEQDVEEALIRKGGSGIPIGPDGLPKPLLPPLLPEHKGRKCLVLDLDETLVHSSFKPVAQADFVVPVEIEYHWHHFHVLKRPGVDEFLRKMGEIYEVVIFTASLSKYADPVLDKLDIHRVVAHRLFRESCFSHKGNYVKDLSQLGRPIGDTIILDNSPASYLFHPHNAVPVSSWFNDPHDAELTDLVPFLRDLTEVGDVRGILDGAR
ncbi:hypothetical protein DXG03_006706 [Asterophora parasitica]|uniref:protein-serine/threonine phosphatase n=1 Tax=Asterophora parasitica TaxID=117018 RepID=A0A9P7G7Z3_9AGAR|nr:hypothetical protein DXG03_006706 [Asterophora parasitica]